MKYSISEVSEKMNLSTHTLRYYEKIGLIPSPKRNEGKKRLYSEEDLNFIIFLKSLKDTGMSLEEMTEFVKGGCILEKIKNDAHPQLLSPSIQLRIEILSKHLEKMEMKKKELENVISATKEKLNIYFSILDEEVTGK